MSVSALTVEPVNQLCSACWPSQWKWTEPQSSRFSRLEQRGAYIRAQTFSYWKRSHMDMIIRLQLLSGVRVRSSYSSEGHGWICVQCVSWEKYKLLLLVSSEVKGSCFAQGHQEWVIAHYNILNKHTQPNKHTTSYEIGHSCMILRCTPSPIFETCYWHEIQNFP